MRNTEPGQRAPGLLFISLPGFSMLYKAIDGVEDMLTNSRYAYSYDILNRVIAGSTFDNNNEYPVYDLNGNITALNRATGTTYTSVDQLTYSYLLNGNQTNQVQSISDISGNNAGLPNGTTTFTYDGNGNMKTQTNNVTTTLNKTVNSYNLLNLPQLVTIPAGTITYTYDAAGNKLRKASTVVGNTTDYINGIEYDSNLTTPFNFIQTEEGKAAYLATTGGFDYYYYLGDNLGNTRVTFDTKTSAATLYQTDDYYPFGKEIPRGTIPNPKNEYLYNKKELQEELGQYDYGARFYDPVIGRFNRIDPVAEHFPWLTSYQYASNNPSTKIDLDGLEGIIPFEPLFFEENAIIPKGTTTGSGYSPENIARAGGDVAKAGDEAVKGSTKSTQEHHVIPRASKGNDFVKEARDGGFKFEGEENKIEVEKYNKSTGEGEHGNHPKYNSELEKKIADLAKDNKDASPGEKAEALRNLAKDLKDLINNNKGTKTNDLFKPAAQDATKTVVPVVKPPQPPSPPPCEGCL